MKLYNTDDLRESVVRFIHSETQKTAGSGFIIRHDGYIITCHHVIYRLSDLVIEYQGRQYKAVWCEKFSNPDVDIAILKVDFNKPVKVVPIISLESLPSSIIVYGFSISKEEYFPKGFDFYAQNIRLSAPIKTISTYRSLDIDSTNSWNKLPKSESTFEAYRLDKNVDTGASGGPVLAEDLGGIVGVIQSTKHSESYVIRWSNIECQLKQLGLEPKKIEPQIPSSIQEYQQKIRYIPQQYNLFFTGRKEVLQRLRKLLLAGCSVALSGIGGVGKTQIAMRYIYEYQEFYTSIL